MKAFVVWINTDLTEGRGMQVPVAVCRTEATALRLAHGADVQGSNGTVHETILLKEKGDWYGPVRIIEPNSADEITERALAREREARAKKMEVLNRAKALGLTDEEIEVLKK